jgi:hypothetical protein
VTSSTRRPARTRRIAIFAVVVVLPDAARAGERQDARLTARAREPGRLEHLADHERGGVEHVRALRLSRRDRVEHALDEGRRRAVLAQSARPPRSEAMFFGSSLVSPRDPSTAGVVADALRATVSVTPPFACELLPTTTASSPCKRRARCNASRNEAPTTR